MQFSTEAGQLGLTGALGGLRCGLTEHDRGVDGARHLHDQRSHRQHDDDDGPGHRSDPPTLGPLPHIQGRGCRRGSATQVRSGGGDGAAPLARPGPSPRGTDVPQQPIWGTGSARWRQPRNPRGTLLPCEEWSGGLTGDETDLPRLRERPGQRLHDGDRRGAGRGAGRSRVPHRVPRPRAARAGPRPGQSRRGAPRVLSAADGLRRVRAAEGGRGQHHGGRRAAGHRMVRDRHVLRQCSAR